MGMDLRPINPPEHVSAMTEGGVAWDDEGKWGRYNIGGWSDLRGYLRRKDFAEDLPVFNDGELIPAAVCREIADLLEREGLNFGMRYEETGEGVRITDWGTAPSRAAANAPEDDEE